MSDFKWSDSEKKIAKRAFDKALGKECASVLEQLKDMAARAEQPKDVWAVQDYLTEQRKLIDRKYDYRYSQLILVFGQLLREKWVGLQDLQGLKEEKIEAIKYISRDGPL